MGSITITVPDDLKRGMRRLRHINWSSVAREAFEEAIRHEEMRKAADAIDKLRGESKSRGWSGSREIRRWRDAAKS